MKKLMLIVAISTFFFSCKKDDAASDPFVGEWYFHLNESAYSDNYIGNGTTGFNVSRVTNKTLVNIESAGSGKYFIGSKILSGKVVDYSLPNSAGGTPFFLATQTSSAAQQFTIEKVPNSTDMYFIKSFSNPDKVLTVLNSPFYANYLTFTTLSNTNSSQQWKLEK
jgi:hypothetical protein